MNQREAILSNLKYNKLISAVTKRVELNTIDTDAFKYYFQGGYVSQRSILRSVVVTPTVLYKHFEKDEMRGYNRQHVNIYDALIALAFARDYKWMLIIDNENKITRELNQQHRISFTFFTECHENTQLKKDLMPINYLDILLGCERQDYNIIINGHKKVSV